MSHVATVQIEIKDLELLDRACGRMGLEFVRDQKTFHWWGNDGPGEHLIPDGFTADEMGHCAHAIRLSAASIDALVPSEAYRRTCEAAARGSKYASQSPFEIGVVLRKDGKPGWQLLYDHLGDRHDWGGFGLESVAGKGLCGVKQAYAIVAARAAAVKQGFRIQELHKPNGAVELRLMK